jgi:hypothetical protein
MYIHCLLPRIGWPCAARAFTAHAAPSPDNVPTSFELNSITFTAALETVHKAPALVTPAATAKLAAAAAGDEPALAKDDSAGDGHVLASRMNAEGSAEPDDGGHVGEIAGAAAVVIGTAGVILAVVMAVMQL